MRFSVEALLGIGAFGYTRLWVRKPDFRLVFFLSKTPACDRKFEIRKCTFVTLREKCKNGQKFFSFCHKTLKAKT
jgi:hypothetical protein